ncbi:PEP-CTERM sorting domain-containing protein [Janthinobacterium fluminis]|uniref:PEP-CTERM sorting domain-containing protein n=1 Tax=Janthinobacterium fluminis TaxID=2987524 RepID=A0ABT5JX78_9BURK|nr:PEP-CTERM sorting domain-containing protein [Janthinobacterium fluminis]MDC8757086.1 PEP-CTERM sorting domain-containing protein [Janthinobacterium fluminis]
MKRLVLLGILFASGLSQAAELYNNGPVVDENGLSVVYDPATTYGFGNQADAGNAVADNFSIAAGSRWNVSSLDFFNYQTGARGFTFGEATWSIVSGDVNAGTVVASGVTKLSNGGLEGYRITDGDVGNTQRGIYRAHADVADFSLDAGKYWLRWSISGSNQASGPWQPPTSDAHGGNAAQAGLFTPFGPLDDGAGLGVELPFTIHGSVSAVPEPETYAMLMAGLFMVGAVARRRKHAS